MSTQDPGIRWTYVNVEPDVVLLTDVCYSVDRIERAEDSRACRRRHQERYSTFRQALGNLLFQVRYDHLSPASHDQQVRKVLWTGKGVRATVVTAGHCTHAELTAGML